MPKKLLSLQEVKRLNSILRDLFRHMTSSRNKDALAENIKYPQIPSILTESLVVHLLQKELLTKELQEHSFKFGGRVADIIGTKNSKNIKIEVKATGHKAFQYFSKKDIDADYLLWLHFSEFYLDESKSLIEAYILKNPNSFFNEPVKIRLPDFKKITGNTLQKKIIDLDKFLP